MKKIFTLSLFAIFTCINLFAQSLTPFVVSTSGGFYSNGNAQLSFTTGEMTMVKTFTAGSSILTQGFQQPFDFGVSVEENSIEDFAFQIFPNPNNGTFSFFIKSNSTASVQIKVYDSIGKIILQKKFDNYCCSQFYPLQLTGANEGIYFLELTINKNKFHKIIQVIK